MRTPLNATSDEDRLRDLAQPEQADMLQKLPVLALISPGAMCSISRRSGGKWPREDRLRHLRCQPQGRMSPRSTAKGSSSRLIRPDVPRR